MIIENEALIIADQSIINTPPPAPKKADGTVDWDVVFQDPNYGLIPALEKASSIEGITHVISVAAQHLYKRRNDASLRSTLINRSEIILSDVSAYGTD
jgi:hypothetical protein